VKSVKPYALLRTPQQADVRFYEGYDAQFLFRKADLIYLVFSRRNEFRAFISSLGCPEEGIDDAFLNGVAAELHCAALQQFEAVFALMLAAFQRLPHWIYLTSYRTAEIKEKAAALAAGDIDAASGRQCADKDAFIAESIYPGVTPPEGDESWGRSLSDLSWFLTSMADQYLCSPEYNAYKHGLRVLPGSARLLVDISRGANEFRPVLSMKHSVTFLEIEERDNHYAAQEVTKEIDPEDAYQRILVMSSIAENIKNIRLAGLRRERTDVSTFSLDRQGLLRLRPVGRFAFPL